MGKISAIKIKALAYADPFTVVADPVAGLKGSEVFAKAWTEVANVHGETFKYEEAEPTVTGYKNQLTGLDYRTDIEQGDVKIDFTIGEYDYATKAALQGGTSTATSWQRPAKRATIYKALKATTEDGVVIVFPKAAIVGRGADTDKAIGLAVTGKAQDTGVTGLASEKWFDAAEIKAGV